MGGAGQVSAALSRLCVSVRRSLLFLLFPQPQNGFQDYVHLPRNHPSPNPRADRGTHVSQLWEHRLPSTGLGAVSLLWCFLQQ